MTVKELLDMHPGEKHFLAIKNGILNWNYNDDDVVVKYEYSYVNIPRHCGIKLKFIWRRHD